MRHLLAGLAACATFLLLVALLRAAWMSRDALPHTGTTHGAEQPSSQESQTGPTDVDEHAAHEVPEPPIERKAEPTPATVMDLGNRVDPVTGQELAANPIYLEHKGWRIGLADESTQKRFQKNPIRYYTPLSLEPTTEGKLLRVDPSGFEKALADECPIMGNPIDPDGKVYLLHRGFKIYFCCWSGCADEFLANPAKHYAHYGLIEKDGKLVRK